MKIAVRVSVFLAVALVANTAAASSIELLPLERASERFDIALACYEAVEVDGYDAGVDAAFELTKAGTDEQRRFAVKILGRIEGPYARAALAVVLCGSPHAGIRAQAADSLAQMADGDSIYLLALAADLEPDASVRDLILARLDRIPEARQLLAVGRTRKR